MNKEEHDTERSEASKTILKRNPDAFKSKIQYPKVCPSASHHTLGAVLWQCYRAYTRASRMDATGHSVHPRTFIDICGA
jgi:hypothetical protein